MRNYGFKKKKKKKKKKKRVSENFDNLMGSYDSAKILKLVGCLLLYKLDIIDPSSHGLYWNDRLIIINNCTPRKRYIKKELFFFIKFGFRLDIQANLKITDYLDVMFNSYNGTVSPFRKNDQYQCYINVESNHPKKVFKQIPNSIMIRLSTNSSNKDIFTQINKIMR